MPSYPQAHFNAVADQVLMPATKRIRRRQRQLEASPIDLVKHHDYREGVHPTEDRGVVRESPLAVVPPARTHKVLGRDWSRLATANLPGPRLSRQEAFLEKVPRADVIGGGAIRSSEVKPTAGRSFTGGKAKDPTATAVRAEQIRTNVERAWDRYHAGYQGALRS